MSSASSWRSGRHPEPECGTECHAMGGDRAHIPVFPSGHSSGVGRSESRHHPQAPIRASPEKSEAEPARPQRAARATSNRKTLYLRVIEPPQHVGQTYDLDDELTIGRSPGCGVATPDDIYTSTLHARLLHNDRALGGRSWFDQRDLRQFRKNLQAQRLGKGDVLQVGSTVYEVAK